MRFKANKLVLTVLVCCFIAIGRGNAIMMSRLRRPEDRGDHAHFYRTGRPGPRRRH